MCIAILSQPTPTQILGDQYKQVRMIYIIAFSIGQNRKSQVLGISSLLIAHLNLVSVTSWSIVSPLDGKLVPVFQKKTQTIHQYTPILLIESPDQEHITIILIRS